MAIKKGKSPVIPAKLSNLIVWLFALISFVLILVAYYNRVFDHTLMPRLFLLSLLLGLFYLSFVFNNKFKLPITGLLLRLPVICWMAFIFISIISLFIAINPSEGIFDISKSFLLVLYLIAAASILIKSNDLRPFIISVILLNIIYLCVGYYEYFTYVFRQVEMESLYKMNGIKSHKNIFSGALYILLTFLVFEVIIAEKAKKIIPSILIFLNLVILILIQTRSIWVALLVFAFISLFLFVIFRKKIIINEFKKKLIQGFYLLGSISVLAIICAFFITGFSVNHSFKKQDNLFQKNIQSEKKTTNEIEGIHERFTSIFNPDSDTRKRRLEIWETTRDLFKEQPVIGVGAGNWKLMIPAYFDQNYIKYFFHNWQRPHNDFIWVFAEKGIPGILAYLGFFISLFIFTFKTLKSKAVYSDKIFALIMFAGLCGYCITASFSFPYERIEIQILMMFMAAGIIWKYHQNFPAKST